MDFGFDFQKDAHQRFNPLTDQWVLVSPNRNERPWSGQVEAPAQEALPAHDPGCYLCPGNTRASGLVNPHYDSTFVFRNDFAALRPDGAHGAPVQDQMFRMQAVSGECRVVCFSPRHDLTLAEMPADAIRHVVDCWVDQVRELEATYAWVQVFENKGAAMGCSNPHPHGQIWASDVVPAIVRREEPNQAYYLDQLGRPFLVDVVMRELERGVRIVDAVGEWVAWVPFWATWPFELLLAPKVHVTSLRDLDFSMRLDLADILRRLLTRYDNLFETSFPYSMGWHFAPPRSEVPDCWQLHAHFFPPLLRSASVRKFMVGYEMLGQAQRDLTPEEAAERLRNAGTQHYKQRPKPTL